MCNHNTEYTKAKPTLHTGLTSRDWDYKWTYNGCSVIWVPAFQKIE